jgi:hypothetical protein
VPVPTQSIFATTIADHLELKRRNAELDHKLPIGRYKTDPFANHPLFRTEEQARREDADEGLWAGARDFDWGD